jgi:para-aminobenzoate synthetase/4-amino-4-deoxychorismate lyase
MLLEESGDYRFEAEHLGRLADSAEYWDFPFDLPRTQRLMTQFARRTTPLPAVARLELCADGSTTLRTRELPPAPSSPVRVLLTERPTDSSDRFLYHKTSFRAFYDAQKDKATRAGFFEVIFANERACVTEGSISNLFARFGTCWVTPPVLDGLLPGIWREYFARHVRAQEKSLSTADLATADEIVIGNSVRGGVAVEEVWTGGEVLWRRRVDQDVG